MVLLASTFRGCLYGIRDGTFARTGLYSGSWHVYVSIYRIPYASICFYLSHIVSMKPGRFLSRPT